VPSSLVGSQSKLYPLKIQLDNTARQIVKMMLNNERKSFNKVVAHLKKRFRPIDIAELRGLEFHQKSQGDDSVEQSWTWICKLLEEHPPPLVLRNLTAC
jgi:hypothetical protein